LNNRIKNNCRDPLLSNNWDHAWKKGLQDMKDRLIKENERQCSQMMMWLNRGSMERNQLASTLADLAFFRLF
jgi:uncharacterized membrane protein YheB (UPF0754 family)